MRAAAVICTLSMIHRCYWSFDSIGESSCLNHDDGETSSDSVDVATIQYAKTCVAVNPALRDHRLAIMMMMMSR
jgi:hypothetical protein